MAGLSNFPGALDTFVNPGPNQKLSDVGVEHDVQHSKVNDTLRSIETTLGINPQGTGATTVAARLDNIQTAVSSLQTNLANVQASGALGLYVKP